MMVENYYIYNLTTEQPTDIVKVVMDGNSND